jgi:hypothetical protein
MNIFNIFRNSTRRAAQNRAPGTFGHDFEKSMGNHLEELSLYGNPRLAKLETGWWCYLEASDAGSGVKLSIGSEIRHVHPADAIAECLQRVRASGRPQLTGSKAVTPHRLRT